MEVRLKIWEDTRWGRFTNPWVDSSKGRVKIFIEVTTKILRQLYERWWSSLQKRWKMKEDRKWKQVLTKNNRLWGSQLSTDLPREWTPGISIACHSCRRWERQWHTKDSYSLHWLKLAGNFSFWVSRMLLPFWEAQLQFGLISQTPKTGSGCKVVGVLLSGSPPWA